MRCGSRLFLYALKVGAAGKLSGLDLSPFMLDKARSNLAAVGVANRVALAPQTTFHRPMIPLILSPPTASTTCHPTKTR